MVHAETRLTRVVVARLEPGEDLHEALRELARWHRIDAARVHGQGILREAALARYEAAALRYGPAEARPGPVELAALSGTISLRAAEQDVRLHAVIAGPDGVAPAAAGLLARATALAVELVLDVWDRADLERVDDPATGLALWRQPVTG